jgi:hypothetical protein
MVSHSQAIFNRIGPRPDIAIDFPIAISGRQPILLNSSRVTPHSSGVYKPVLYNVVNYRQNSF